MVGRISPDGRRESLGRGMPQNQNRGMQAGLTQFHGFQHGADSEKGTPSLQQPGHLNGAMAIGIRLDHRHHCNPGLFPHRFKIGGNGIQVNFYQGTVKTQTYQLTYLTIETILA